MRPTNETGTTVTFWPDASIFETVEFSFETIIRRLQEMAFLNKGLTIVVQRRAGGEHERARSPTTTPAASPTSSST